MKRSQTHILCPNCGGRFVPHRKNKRYCSSSCARIYNNRLARSVPENLQNSERSREKRRANERLVDDAVVMSKKYRSEWVVGRGPAYLETCIERAKTSGPTRQVLLNRELRASAKLMKHHMRRHYIQEMIGDVADEYCREAYGMSLAAFMRSHPLRTRPKKRLLVPGYRRVRTLQECSAEASEQR